MNTDYKPFHPKWHRPRMPIFWWLSKPAYTRFISRELTSLAVGYGALLLLVQTWFLARGAEAYEGFLGWLAMPAIVAFHGVVLLVAVFHSVTWLNLTPKAMVFRLRGRRVPDGAIAAVHYLAWIAVSAIVFWSLGPGS